MENSIYHSMLSANQLLEKQNIISNNLANISTTGFKEKFNYILQIPEQKNLYNNYNKVIKEYYNLEPGTPHHTERNLDVFIKDDGWLTVQDANGQEAYTKNGHLKINAENKLTIQNHEVMGNNGSITIPQNVNLKILSDGIITSIDKQNNKLFKTQIDKLKLIRFPEENLIQKENGLFYLQINRNLNKHSKNINQDIRLESGMLEESNVNPSKNMIDMISNARQFDMQMKMISICDQNAERANQLIDINN